jgi:hypothetical protein
MTRAHALLNDTLALAFGSLAGRVVGILLLPLYTYTLSRTEFGTAELITTAVDLTVPLIFLCLSEAVLRFVMASHEATEKVISTVGGGPRAGRRRSTCFGGRSKPMRRKRSASWRWSRRPRSSNCCTRPMPTS